MHPFVNEKDIGISIKDHSYPLTIDAYHPVKASTPNIKNHLVVTESVNSIGRLVRVTAASCDLEMTNVTTLITFLVTKTVAGSRTAALAKALTAMV